MSRTRRILVDGRTRVNDTMFALALMRRDRRVRFSFIAVHKVPHTVSAVGRDLADPQSRSTSRRAVASGLFYDPERAARAAALCEATELEHPCASQHGHVVYMEVFSRSGSVEHS
jgi:hypothetical protein